MDMTKVPIHRFRVLQLDENTSWQLLSMSFIHCKYSILVLFFILDFFFEDFLATFTTETFYFMYRKTLGKLVAHIVYFIGVALLQI